MENNDPHYVSCLSTTFCYSSTQLNLARHILMSFSFFFHLKAKDQYGNEVQKLARPLPVEYLLLDVPTSSPKVPLYTFPAHVNPFPVENRLIDGHLQDYGSTHKYLERYESSPLEYLKVKCILQFSMMTSHISVLISQAVSNFHLLLYLYGLELFDTKFKAIMTPLLDAVRTQDEHLASTFMKSEDWATFEHLISAHSGPE